MFEYSEKLYKCLNEVIDALGEIPASEATKKQKRLYRLCIEERDQMFKIVNYLQHEKDAENDNKLMAEIDQLDIEYKNITGEDL